jgi:hypothetical protein
MRIRHCGIEFAPAFKAFHAHPALKRPTMTRDPTDPLGRGSPLFSLSREQVMSASHPSGSKWTRAGFAKVCWGWSVGSVGVGKELGAGTGPRGCPFNLNVLAHSKGVLIVSNTYLTAMVCCSKMGRDS